MAAGVYRMVVTLRAAAVAVSWGREFLSVFITCSSPLACANVEAAKSSQQHLCKSNEESCCRAMRTVIVWKTAGLEFNPVHPP